ncbi:hypothetical protein [Candidatus Nitronereus thalassa]|uniref:Transporter n=1 Tax=Candidatus Nitronereus thalassa TaxID=3020898 RepID=A0ABU3K3H7_9BACT|nr:hypothetical protein [Candidatus Nitronereus thalassa]MDT7040962.1 hypothetical protein [Candidatus Nitronereus thalassa]
MFDGFNSFPVGQKRILGWMIIGILMFPGMLGQAHAALLEGVMSEWEELIAGKVAEKGEKLVTGNFYTAEKPNAHGPIGMMGEHTHDKGEFMFSYRYMHMFMEGTRNGTNSISNAQARALVPTPGPPAVVPTSMLMEMHMFGFMYGLNDTVTLTAMVPYLRNTMNHEAGATFATKFTTRSEGIGDIRFGSLWRLWAVEAPSIGAHRFHANFAVSVPTGDTEPRDKTPVSNPFATFRLPFPMHLGSGTYDLYPGFTYGGEKGRSSWGFQSIGTIRLGKNAQGFARGDAIQVTAFGAYEIIKKWLSGSVRFDFNHWDDHRGTDPGITGQAGPPVQTAIPTRLGGERLDVLGGINLLLPEFMGFETRLAVEGGVPIYQWLQGQLETDSIVTFGWQGVY